MAAWTLETLGAELERLKTRVDALESGSGAVAPDADLDGQWGNPKIRKDPKRWPGRSYVGRTYSDTEPDYLDALHDFLIWCAEREAATPGKEKYATYSRRDAARARGWARRLRAGWKPKPAPEQPEWLDGLEGGPSLDDAADAMPDDDGSPFQEDELR